MQESKSSLPKNIAVFRLSAMGDVAMIVPVLRGFTRNFPDVKITVVSKPFFAPFFEDIPNVFFYAIDVKKRHKGLIGLCRLFKDLRALSIDAFIDLHNVLRSHVVVTLFKWSGIPVAIMDKGRSDKKELTQLSLNKKITPIKTVFERHLETFNRLNYSFNLNASDCLEKKNVSQDVFKLIGVQGQNTKLIGIAPFAQHNTKVYPLDLMKEVITLLSENEVNVNIILFGGGRAEKELLDALALSIDRCINITGLLKFNQELALISNLDVMLSMDSGNGHMAAMYGVPVITMWGNTHPYAGFVPFNQPLGNSLTPDVNKYPYLPTSIYGNKEIEGYVDCIKTISPQKVVAKLKEVIF